MSGIDLIGMGVAIVTPFKEDKTIDFEALEKLIEYLVGNGCDYLVVLGTTAETPTLSKEERTIVKNFVRDRVNGRIPLVVGYGGNNTMSLIDDITSADLEGFSAILSVVPYYNKPSQDGIYQHYKAIAEASPLPIILYNVPGRTGVNMSAKTTLRLANDFNNIIAIKEASGDLNQIKEIIENKPKGFKVISGDDGVTLSLIKFGGSGVISVIGNAFPKEFGDLVRLALTGKFSEAENLHNKFSELFRLLFTDGNPSGIKCMLNKLGIIKNELRLPLVSTRKSTEENIKSSIEKFINS